MAKDKKLLVVLTPGFPRDEADTACLPLQQQLLQAMQKVDPELEIIVFSFQYPFYKSTYSWHGIKVIALGGSNRGGFSPMMIRMIVLNKLKELQRTKGINAILSFWYGECARTARYFAGKNNIRHACWILGQDARKENRYPSRYPLPEDQLVALSDSIKKEMKQNHGIEPAYTVCPGIDSINNTNSDRPIDLIAVGSLIALKRNQIFVEIVAHLNKIKPAIKAVLIGEGYEKDMLELLIERNHIEQNITLTGALPNEEVIKWMQKSKILVHPSSYEGFGVVCAEALAAGAYVISFVQPLDRRIDKWEIVTTKDEMKERALAILNDPEPDFRPVIISSPGAMAGDMFNILFPANSLPAL